MRYPQRRPRVFYGWYVLAASFIILFLSAGGQSIIGVMVKPMAADLDWSRSAISSAIFLNMAVYALAVIVTGRLYDRHGPRWVIAGSALLFSAGYALMATMDSLWQFFLYFGVLAGAGLGGITVPMFGSVLGKWFERRRGLVISLGFVGFCLGQFVLIPVFSDMIDGSGWRSTSAWIALLSLVIIGLLALVIIRGDPKRFGLQAYGSAGRPAAPDHADSGADPAPSEAHARLAAPTVTVVRRDLTLTEAMRSRSLWLFAFAMFVCGAGDSLVLTHIVPLVTDYGLSTTVASGMLAWMGLVGLGGVLLAGPAADAVGTKIPIAAMFGLRIVLLVMLLVSKGTGTFWVFSVGFGFTLPISAPLVTVLVCRLYGVTHLGFIAGFITTVHMVGGGLWSYLGGVVYDRTGDYDLAWLISAGLAAVATVCMLFVREERPRCRRAAA